MNFTSAVKFVMSQQTIHLVPETCRFSQEHEVRVDSQAFTSFAENSAKRGEVRSYLMVSKNI